jgi:hypothetical protein
MSVAADITANPDLRAPAWQAACRGGCARTLLAHALVYTGIGTSSREHSSGITAIA